MTTDCPSVLLKGFENDQTLKRNFHIKTSAKNQQNQVIMSYLCVFVLGVLKVKTKIKIIECCAGLYIYISG